MFFRQIMEAFLVRTEPDSSMVNPAAHPHDERSPDQEHKGVEDELCLPVNPLSLGDVPRAPERTQSPEAPSPPSPLRVCDSQVRSLAPPPVAGPSGCETPLNAPHITPPSGTLLAEVVGPSPSESL